MFSQASVSHSVHNWPHCYSVTAHPCYGAVGTHPPGMVSCIYMEFMQLRPVFHFKFYF